MIDFIKGTLQNIDMYQLENNPLLDFEIKVSTKTGELKENICRIAKYKNLEFRIYPSGSIWLQGSLHVFWNNGEHNYNDFDKNALIKTLKEIEIKFNIKPEQIKLCNLEIGINFTPPYKTQTILRHCFLHGTQLFEKVRVPNEGNYYQCEHEQYYVKIYDKAQHYKSKGIYSGTEQILRFELKFVKMEKLNKIGIYTMQNVIDTDFNIFIDMLVIEWQNILFYDWTIKHNSQRLLNYNNPMYWHEMKNTRSNYDKHKKQLREYIRNNSENIPLIIENIIRQKGIVLNCKGANIDSLYILSKRIPPIQNNTLCKLTGLNITMQKKESSLLSHSGLRYYHQNEPKTYEYVKNKYLSITWQYSDFNTQIKEIAHNIRNEYNNVKAKQSRLYTVNQMQLF